MSSLVNLKNVKKEALALVEWYSSQKRPLPWRQSRNPYPIWISEIMLQQTPVKAVIPYFQKFMKAFPTIEDLAEASLEEVYSQWAGLGYYSRARNLKNAARVLSAMPRFPQTYQELLALPGFGPYTARAVSSQAFNEPVGVVDGNVIRVLSRRYGLPIEHWKAKERDKLQVIADSYAQVASPSDINQAWMELGATLCSPQTPSCLLCPLQSNCVALKENKVQDLPLKKTRRASEIWLWQLKIFEKENGSVAFVRNEQAPFLRNQWVLPGHAKKRKTPPSQFDFQHAITHHKIYVQVTRGKSNFEELKNLKVTWISRKGLKEKVPFSIIQKTIDIGLGDRNKN